LIRPCDDTDISEIFEIVNDAATAYKGVIPADRYDETYMSMGELREQIAEGVRFWGWEEGGRLEAVMGIQKSKDATLVRHAYVRTASRRKGLGGKLLQYLLGQADPPVLVGTWAAAKWAVQFYEKNGFVLADEAEKNRLLRAYWKVPDRQIETSVVLRFARHKGLAQNC
jgi:GNAT superfamily N-acetyltransferase